MIDIFGSKTLHQVTSNIIGPEKLNSSVISSSLESQFSTSLTLSNSKLDQLNGMERSIVENEYKKSFRLNGTRGKYLLVDFLSERNNIVQYNKSKLTSNTEIRKFLENEKTKNVILDNRAKSIPSYIDRFTEIADSYEKVIVAELYLTNYSLDENNMLVINPNQYGINKVNALLKTFYEHLKFKKSNYNYIKLEDYYSDISSNGRVSPWLYSELTNKKLEELLHKCLL
ncbi:DUF6270 domain-containing protein [Jeotgalicoccus sp. ATCC 8456]|uniref:DUF6270 domain-containing protein n=1 Tax=Jeotgalicoccus sp. ATCC 8456 TaxID=946435 RepID=UPI0018E5C8C8|nr:DUF6270 domain-containing protein [Jeotgalicoccus sp. ATCC 8456]QQD85666.1 hypothetical protein JEM45_03310 [Jeotgalicoccus sp. ATCC 8456]